MPETIVPVGTIISGGRNVNNQPPIPGTYPGQTFQPGYYSGQEYSNPPTVQVLGTNPKGGIIIINAQGNPETVPPSVLQNPPNNLPVFQNVQQAQQYYTNPPSTQTQPDNIDLNAVSRFYQEQIRNKQPLQANLLPSERENIQQVYNTTVQPIQQTAGKIQTLNDLFASNYQGDVGGQTSSYISNLQNQFTTYSKDFTIVSLGKIGTSTKTNPFTLTTLTNPNSQFPLVTANVGNEKYTNPVLGDIGEGIKAVGRGVVNLGVAAYLTTQLPSLIGATANLPTTERNIILGTAFSPSNLWSVTAAPIIAGLTHKPVSTILEIAGAIGTAKVISSVVNFEYEPNTGIKTTTYVAPLTKTTGEVVAARVGTSVEYEKGLSVEIENIYEPSGNKIFDQAMTDVTKIGEPKTYNPPSAFTQFKRFISDKPPEPTLNYQLFQTAGADIVTEKSNIPTENYKFGSRFEIYDASGQLVYTAPRTSLGIGTGNVALEESVTSSAVVSRSEVPIFNKDLERIGFTHQRLENPHLSLDFGNPSAEEIKSASATNLIQSYELPQVVQDIVGEKFGIDVKGSVQETGFENGAFKKSFVLNDEEFQQLFHKYPNKVIKEELNTQNFGGLKIGSQSIVFERGALIDKQVTDLSQAPEGTRIVETSTYRFIPIEKGFEQRSSYVNIKPASLQEIENSELATFMKNKNVLNSEGYPAPVGIFKSEGIDVIEKSGDIISKKIQTNFKSEGIDVIEKSGDIISKKIQTNIQTNQPSGKSTLTVGANTLQESSQKLSLMEYTEPTFRTANKPKTASPSDIAASFNTVGLSNQPLYSTNLSTQPSIGLETFNRTNPALATFTNLGTNEQLTPIVQNKPAISTNLVTRSTTATNLSTNLQPALQLQPQLQNQLRTTTATTTYPFFKNEVGTRKKRRFALDIKISRFTKGTPRIIPPTLFNIAASERRYGNARFTVNPAAQRQFRIDVGKFGVASQEVTASQYKHFFRRTRAKKLKKRRFEI